MSKITLGVNNCFAIGRYPEPEEWLGVVKSELGLEHVQFSFDMLDPVIIDDEIVKQKITPNAIFFSGLHSIPHIGMTESE
ncbi:hypothetical protein LCGC14_2868580, partial [marine sediment metagenome]